MTIGIYKIQNKINGKVYIGQSIDIERRLKQHSRELRGSRHYNPHLQNAFNKYGEENFKAYIIAICSPEQLDLYEKWFISVSYATDRKYGYNIEIGGNKAPTRCKENHPFWREDIHRDEEKIIKMYKQGIGIKGISEQYNCHRSTIQKILERNFVPRNPSIIEKKKRSKSRNKTGFFRVSKKNNNQCKQGFNWIYRFYYKQKRIEISSVDLYKLRKK